MNQRGWLQRVADTLLSKLTRRDAAELSIDQWQQLIERGAVAAAPTGEERRDVVSGGHQSSSKSFVILGFQPTRSQAFNPLTHSSKRLRDLNWKQLLPTSVSQPGVVYAAINRSARHRRDHACHCRSI